MALVAGKVAGGATSAICTAGGRARAVDAVTFDGGNLIIVMRLGVGVQGFCQERLAAHSGQGRTILDKGLLPEFGGFVDLGGDIVLGDGGHVGGEGVIVQVVLEVGLGGQALVLMMSHGVRQCDGECGLCCVNFARAGGTDARG